MSDAEAWMAAVLRLRRAMIPTPTTVEPELRRLDGVRAVIFDVYGTLVISGSGDVGTADQTDRGSHMLEALSAVGLGEPHGEVPTIDMLQEEIQRSNDRRRSDGCPYPEVDIAEVWRRVLQQCGIRPQKGLAETSVRLAAEYEARANPTWPMPGAVELLGDLRAAGVPLGIVSNAQVFTPLLVRDLVGGTPLLDSGFDLDLCVFSNRFRQAKPGARLFDVLCEGLSRRGFRPDQTIYVGNDMLNDVWAAAQAGLRTAWFAGDARSCRPRRDDPRCRSLRPDVVLTNLVQLLQCIEI